MLLAFAMLVNSPQIAPRASDWESYSKPRFAQAETARQKKDYATALRLTNETLVFLRKMSPADRRDVHQEGNILHYLAWIYCGMGDSLAALKNLSDAVDNGFGGYEQLAKEHELDPLRGNPEFDAIVLRARQKYDYLFVLQSAAPYDREPARRIDFSFQEAKQLKRITENINLSVIAGVGDEASRAIRLMRWVHLMANHDGANSPKVGKNAKDLLSYAQTTGNGLNCRCLSITLNDLYLAAGFKSRIVACMPKDLNDEDCHVIVSVFLPSLKKWVWMDPSFEGYMKDENGALLSIEEVRQRLIVGKPVIPADELEWNGGIYRAESYLRYMKKNLYWFTIPIRSQSDYETGGMTGEYASLIPTGFDIQEHRAVITSDPTVFWKTP